MSRRQRLGISIAGGTVHRTIKNIKKMDTASAFMIFFPVIPNTMIQNAFEESSIKISIVEAVSG
ncbi:MAG TPA: hypothetical protein HPQ03_14735 [Deltaproteobacteria bacterium]|nr:hypothetical protein [Deltaproteobacteria bacterium]